MNEKNWNSNTRTWIISTFVPSRIISDAKNIFRLELISWDYSFLLEISMNHDQFIHNQNRDILTLSKGGWHTIKETASLQFRTSCITWSRGARFTSSPLIWRIWSPGINLLTLGPPLVTNLQIDQMIHNIISKEFWIAN